MDTKNNSDPVAQIQMLMPINPSSLIQMNEFPDILQQCPIEQCKLVLESLAATPNNASLVNKSGSAGGYTALHW